MEKVRCAYKVLGPETAVLGARDAAWVGRPPRIVKGCWNVFLALFTSECLIKLEVRFGLRDCGANNGSCSTSSSQAVGPRAGAIGGGWASSPMWVRMRLTGTVSVMKATMRNCPLLVLLRPPLRARPMSALGRFQKSQTIARE